eukprot:3320079-Rhodomonas_salina.1
MAATVVSLMAAVLKSARDEISCRVWWGRCAGGRQSSCAHDRAGCHSQMRRRYLHPNPKTQNPRL